MPKLVPKLVVNTGSMFASKSSALITQGKRHLLAGHKVVFVKPAIDDRYSVDDIVTHDGQKVEAYRLEVQDKAVLYIREILDAEVILIDEVQFFDSTIVGEISDLVNRGKVIYVSGLDMDYRAKPFHVTSSLMGIANEVLKYSAVCSDCGADSYVTAKTSGTDDRVEIGSKDIYKPVCRECYKQYKGGVN